MSEESRTERFAPDVAMTRNDALHQYELRVADTLAVRVKFRDLPGHVDLIHTETQAGFEGKGLAKVLGRYALDDVVASGKRIIPHCPFINRFIRNHPDDYDQYTDFPEDAA
ncbi:GNAT family N-acetyltransferase [Specibacter cremeus]|uniref:GNAT family N-acetyltransferase n=1 Tax=Specibacter cremeus TaxID=1629051 RepID=UPI000F79CB28|nr:GNAT family N-acetyltransferase [Specibacter cremeus]